MQVKEDYILGEEWMIFILLFSLFIIALLRWRWPKKFIQLFESLLHTRIARQRMRDDQLFASNFSMLLSLNYLLMMSFFIHILFKYFNQDLIGQFENHILWFSFIVILVIYTLKSLAVKITELLFDRGYGSGEYLYNVFLFNKGLGIVLVPINIVLALASKQLAGIFIWASIVVIGLFLLIRLLRGMKIGLENNARILYLILYLCALEVLPTTLIVKELAGNVN